MRYTTVKNLRWANPEHTLIECVVDFEGLGELPFGAHPGDAEPHGREIFQRCVSGEFGAISEFVPPPPPTDEEKAAFLRFLRDQKLTESDWTDTVSAKTRLGDDLWNAWQDYRQALRDFPQQPDFPNNTQFPTPPQ